jgi:hypothetical protein
MNQSNSCWKQELVLRKSISSPCSLIAPGASDACVPTTASHLPPTEPCSLALTGSIRNRHNERPVDLLPPSHPSADPESDDEKIRAAIRRAEAEAAVADKGDIADGEFDYWLSTL